MKATIIFLLLTISYYTFGQSIKGVFEQAKPISEVTDFEYENRDGLYVIGEEGGYSWFWKVTTVGYARSLEKAREILEWNNYQLTPDEDRSIIPNNVDDKYSDYQEMALQCKLENAEIIMNWFFHDDWILTWTVDDESAMVTLTPKPRQMPNNYHLPTNKK